jgi:hypothetical protein
MFDIDLKFCLDKGRKRKVNSIILPQKLNFLFFIAQVDTRDHGENTHRVNTIWEYEHSYYSEEKSTNLECFKTFHLLHVESLLQYLGWTSFKKF